jgi:hypothetical protein
MHKLDASQLQALGAPTKGGAQQIEDWLRGLLQGGTLRLDCGLVELRGSQPVITTLGDLKRACGVAMETAKQGLRALEMEHWVLLVDARAHTVARSAKISCQRDEGEHRRQCGPRD